MKLRNEKCLLNIIKKRALKAESDVLVIKSNGSEPSVPVYTALGAVFYSQSSEKEFCIPQSY